jgi:hypothetical protein
MGVLELSCSSPAWKVSDPYPIGIFREASLHGFSDEIIGSGRLIHSPVSPQFPWGRAKKFINPSLVLLVIKPHLIPKLCGVPKLCMALPYDHTYLRWGLGVWSVCSGKKGIGLLNSLRSLPQCCDTNFELHLLQYTGCSNPHLYNQSTTWRFQTVT